MKEEKSENTDIQMENFQWELRNFGIGKQNLHLTIKKHVTHKIQIDKR